MESMVVHLHFEPGSKWPYEELQFLAHLHWFNLSTLEADGLVQMESTKKKKMLPATTVA